MAPTPPTKTRRPSRVETIVTALRQRLKDGEWPPGSQLPTEKQMCDEHSTSRATIRSALSELEGLGLVITRHGSGTYSSAAGDSIRADLRRLESITETVQRAGHKVEVEFHSIAIRAANASEREQLQLSEGAEILITQRTIRADEVEIAFSQEAIPVARVGREAIGTSPDGSLFHMLEDHGLTATSARTEIHAAVGETLGEHAPGELLIHLNQLHYLNDQTPIMIADTYFVEGRFQFGLVRLV
jgi:GntR family transcriptional regulator